MIWHQDSTSLVLIGPTKHHLQFFDPLERRQKFALEIISQNIILGEREGVYIFYLLSISLSFLLSDLNLGNSTCHLMKIVVLFFLPLGPSNSPKLCSRNYRGLFSTGAMGALATTILKNRPLAPAIFGHFSIVGNLRVQNKNPINTQHPKY